VSPVATLPDLGQDGVLRVAFQPIYEVRADSRRVHSLEGLVRGPRGTPFESASVLFDHVRCTGQEVSVDRVCMAAIFRALVALSWQPDVAVNVHASTLGSDADFVPFLEGLAAREGVSLARLTLEIVEHASPRDERILATNLGCLRAHGIRIALDDVGVGHSNYRMMLDCRPDLIKIDRYLVAGCHADPQRQAVLESIARLAPRLGARAVAEGVEEQDDLWTLAALGIDLVQGFLLSEPFFPREVTAAWWDAVRDGSAGPRRKNGRLPESEEVLP
jgi:EAL domain-containing protein (putative c-di-GMP-specific phosphodiesterase class I)